MNPTHRRKSTLGRRNRNGEKAEKILLGHSARPTATPNCGLGRLKAGASSKASQEFIIRKQLFSTFSSGKKAPFGCSSRATYSSPNESQGSYQSDSSLNLTGVQSIKIASPDYKSTTSNHTVKSYEGYNNMLSGISVATPSYLNKPKIWDAMNLEPPLSPPPSRYDRLIQLEMACIKPPVDPDDLMNLENLALYDISDSKRFNSRPITSTVAKEVDFSKFSPHLSSTCVNSTIVLSTEKSEKPTACASNTDQTPGKNITFLLNSENDISHVSKPSQTDEKVEICNSKMHKIGNNYCDDSTNKSFCVSEKSSDFENRMNYNQFNGSLNRMSKNLELRLNSQDSPNSSNERQLKPSSSEKALCIFDKDQFDSSIDQTSSTVNPINPVSRSLQFGFSKPLELSSSQNSTYTGKYFETSRGTRLFGKNLDSTLSCELNHSLNISSALPTTKQNSMFNTDNSVTLNSKEESNIERTNKLSETDNKLSVIDETIEKDSSGEDFNSTVSFLMAEQTIIDQDQFATVQLNKGSRTTVVNNKHSIPEVCETLGSDDEISQAMIKVDTVINKIIRVRKEMNEWENELNSVKTNLQQLIVKRNKSKDKGSQNKENIPTTETKKINNKWFNEVKSENPNLLKTPNPARQSISRMSLANQSIRTPHSLSVVVSDQLDDLFN